MTCRILIAVAVAIGALASSMPAVHSTLAPCGPGSCTVQAPTVLADDDEDWDDEDWDDEDWGPDPPGPWANFCGGFDTGFGVFDIGTCTPNLIGP
jgi:hypothetical protein